MGAQGSTAKKGSKELDWVRADSPSLWQEAFLDRGREPAMPASDGPKRLKCETLIQILACMIDEGNPDTELFMRAELEKYRHRDVFETLATAFAEERDVQTLRMTSIFANTSWRRKPPLMSNIRYLGRPGEFPFGTLLDAIAIGLRLVEGTPDLQSGSEMILQSAIEHFGSASPGWCMGPLQPDFFGEQNGQTGDLRVKKVIPHGMSSNGQFLFCLSDEQTLEVFPLMSGGSFIGRRSLTLPFSVSEDSSLIALQGWVKIISSDKEYRLRIDKLVAPESKEIHYEVEPRKGAEICCISDGAIMVKIGADFVARTIDLRESKGSAVLNEVCLQPQRLPGPRITNWGPIPMVTNGAYLSMLLWEEGRILCRTFSLITGEHVGDDRIENTNPIYGITLDIYNHCYWVLTPVPNGQLGIRKVYFAGGCDPYFFGMENAVVTKNSHVSAKEELFIALIRKLYVHVMHFLGSQFVLPVFDCCHGVNPEGAMANFMRLIELTEQILQSSALKTDLKNDALAVMAGLISENITPDLKGGFVELRERIFSIIQRMPIHLGIFLFFRNVNFWLERLDASSLGLMVYLLKACRDPHLLFFAFKNIEIADNLAAISFISPDFVSFTNLLPDTVTEKKDQVTTTLLLIHQRVLFAVTESFLISDPYAVVDLRAGEKTPLKWFSEYASALINKCIAGISQADSLQPFLDSCLYSVLYNFLQLLPSLIDYNGVVQWMVPMLQPLTQSMGTLVRTFGHENWDFLLLVYNCVYAFGRYCASLLMGGGVTEFERKYPWVIHGSLPLLNDEQFFQNDIPSIRDEQIRSFADTGDAIMRSIYSKSAKWGGTRPAEAIRLLDKLALAVFAKHMRCIPQLQNFDGSQALPEGLAEACKCVQTARNSYRRMLQTGNSAGADSIMAKLVLLAKIETNGTVPSNSLLNFVTSNNPQDFIFKILHGQLNRIQITLTGFAQIEPIFGMEVDPLFPDVMGYAMGQITSSTGLSSVVNIQPLSAEQHNRVIQFFRKLAEAIEKEKSDNGWLSVAYVFFRDVHVFPDVQREFLQSLISLFLRDRSRIPLFLLCMSVLENLDVSAGTVDLKIPEDDQGPDLLLLRERASRKGIHVVENLDILMQSIFTGHGIPLHFDLLILQSLLRQIEEGQVIRILTDIVRRIGQDCLCGGDPAATSEMVSFARTILMEKSQLCSLMLYLYENNGKTCQNRECFELIIGLLGIIGYVEEPRAMCTFKFTHDPEAVEYLLIYVDQSRWKLRIPLTVRGEIEPVTGTEPSYVVPQAHVPPYPQVCQFVLDCRNFCLRGAVPGSIDAFLMSQALASLCKFPEFVEKLSEFDIESLSAQVLRFDDIQETAVSLSGYRTKPVSDPHCGFSTLRDSRLSTISYVSPVIVSGAPEFVVDVVSTNKTWFYVGIVSDVFEKGQTLYSVFECPSCHTYPVNYPGDAQLANNYSVRMLVDVNGGVFKVGRKSIRFPYGTQFRIIVASPFQVEIIVRDYANVFITREACPPVCQEDFLDDASIFNARVMADQRFQTLPPTPAQAPIIRDVIWLPDDVLIHRLRGNFVKPPQPFFVHPGWAMSASREILDDMARGAFSKLSRQWATIALMRIAIANPRRVIPVALKLLSALVLCLEKFSREHLISGRFPFAIDRVLTDSTTECRTLHLGLQNEARKALNSMLKDEHVLNEIYEQMIPWSTSWKRHLFAFPTESHELVFVPNAEAPSVVRQMNVPALVCPNDISSQPCDNCVATINRQPVTPLKLPVILAPPSKIVFDAAKMGEQRRLFMSILFFLPNLSWVPHGPFELLLCLKSCVQATKSSRHKAIAKGIFLNCVISNSPLIRFYFREFLSFIECEIPTSPLDSDPYYISRLSLLASQLRQSPDRELIEFYLHQQRMFGPLPKSLCCHFPEFFSSVSESPHSDVCQIPFTPVDPAAIKDDFQNYMVMLRLFARRYTSLVGFPFWELLPLWVRLSESEEPSDSVRPTTSIIHIQGREIMCVWNPCIDKLPLEITVKGSIGRDIVLSWAQTPDFENESLAPAHAGLRCTLDRGRTYFACPGLQNPWRYFNFNFRESAIPPRPSTITVNMKSIHDEFVADMKQFALDWKDEHTAELLSLITRADMRSDTFAQVARIAKNSILCSEFNPRVVALRALIVHHFNYIRYNHQRALSNDLVHNFTTFLCMDDALEALLNQIICSNNRPPIVVNRKAGRRIMEEGRGDPSLAIISQLTKIFMETGATVFRKKDYPWKVSFVDELGIDGGGLAVELFTDTAVSIFHPTTRLVMPIPDDRYAERRLTFLPITDISPYDEQRMWAIGVFLGMVMRTGLYQDLPFHPLVWKFLAGAPITGEDVLACDQRMKRFFDDLTKGNVQTTWVTETWDGRSVVLPRRANVQVTPAETQMYITECIHFRIQALMPALRAMRRGFVENIGFERNKLMTGPVLSRLAQGQADLPVARLQSITTYTQDLRNNQRLIGFYWEAVERLTTQQRQLLLKFVTGVTRVPNSATGSDFRIVIDIGEANGDSRLPNAAVCFKKLVLPAYSSSQVCYEKLVQAIENCATMENK